VELDELDESMVQILIQLYISQPNPYHLHPKEKNRKQLGLVVDLFVIRETLVVNPYISSLGFYV
jgi:hypothetical protein